MTVDPLQYARRWKTLARALSEPGDHRARQHDPQRRAADAAGRVRRFAFEAAVDGRLLPARLRGLLLVFGTLGDRFGRKLALQAGVSIFGLASLGALVADSADQVIAVRAAMGVGAALIMPATLSIIANLFTGDGTRQGDRRSGPRWPRSASGSDRWPAGCCSSGSAGRLSSWSTCRSPLPRCCSASATCPRAAIHGRGGSTCSERRSPRPASASSSTRSSRRPSRVG